MERKIFHPTMVNVVQHGYAEAFQIRMPVYIGFERLGFDVLLCLGLNGDNSLFCLDSKVNLAF